MVTNDKKGASMQIAAGKFKATCLKLMEEVSKSHEAVVITKRGKPIARLLAIEEENPGSLFGFLKDSVISEKDIVEPIEEVWNANK